MNGIAPPQPSTPGAGARGGSRTQDEHPARRFRHGNAFDFQIRVGVGERAARPHVPFAGLARVPPGPKPAWDQRAVKLLHVERPRRCAQLSAGPKFLSFSP
jgi:hypothetical protein